jgi:hypothetical protein
MCVLYRLAANRVGLHLVGLIILIYYDIRSTKHYRFGYENVCNFYTFEIAQYSEKLGIRTSLPPDMDNFYFPCHTQKEWFGVMLHHTFCRRIRHTHTHTHTHKGKFGVSGATVMNQYTIKLCQYNYGCNLEGGKGKNPPQYFFYLRIFFTVELKGRLIKKLGWQ